MGAEVIVFHSLTGQLKASLKNTAPKRLTLLINGKRSQIPSSAASSKGDDR